MRIGSVSIPSPLVLAPMAGVTDLAFRTICRELGAGYTITEMVSAKALCYQDQKTLPLMRLGEDEHPAGVQIFGSDLACMEEGAAIVREVAHPDIIDINMGCPVPKVANNGDGSGLLRDLDKACRVAEAVRKGAGEIPVTVKMRLGWDKGNIVCLELAQCLEDLGIAAITLHGRTKVQMYAGTANWDWIRRVKQALSIPVIANGDVFSGQDAARILRYTGADGVMIARGVFGNPWIFQQAQAAIDGRPIPPLPPLSQRCDTAVRQFELAAQYKSEKIACLEARKGDQDAFTRLVERHQKMVYNLALGKTGSHHDAEEVTQTAFFKAWQGLPSFQGKAAFSSWLYRLTVNAAIDLLRQRKKHQGALSLDDPDLPVVPDRGPSPEELSEEHERRQLLWQAIESLPEPHRIPLLLREIEGLSYREIAQALDLEEGTVKSRLARARLLLRKLLLQKGNLPTGSPSNQLGRKGGMSK